MKHEVMVRILILIVSVCDRDLSARSGFVHRQLVLENSILNLFNFIPYLESAGLIKKEGDCNGDAYSRKKGEGRWL